MNQNHEPLVSVVIPSYHGSELIAETLRGVKNQTYPSIEIIVVDDNGRGTEEQKATERVMQDFPDVRYLVHEKNKKGSAARNTGIRASQGEYIAFLDDDDVWERNKIARQVARMEQLDCSYGLIYAPFVMAYADGTAEAIVQPYEGSVLFAFMMGRARIGSSLMMIRRDVLKDVPGFDESFVRHQDWEFISRIAVKYQIAFEPNAWTVKYARARNSPNEIEKIEQYRLYFLEKMEEPIASLSDEQRTALYDYQYTFLAKENLRRKKLGRCVFWLRKTTRPCYYGYTLIRDAVKKMRRDHRRDSLDAVLKRIGAEL